LPTLYEQCCLSVYEAAAAGLPVVTTPVSGMEELVGADEAGLLVPRDPGAFAPALGRLAVDARLRRRLGETGRERAATFTWERAVEGILAAYRELGLRI
jgi:glycosyltransferase involved in cell wall biosynthesis